MRSNGFKVHLNRELSKNCLLIDPKDCYAVLTLNWLFDALQSGLPPELVEKLYDDHNGLLVEAPKQPGESDDFRVLYVSVDDTEEPVHLRRVIAAMNLVTQMSLSIYCSKKLHRIVKDFANEHIQFVDKKEGPRIPTPLYADLVITFGPGALHFVRQEIPVMIVGPYGYGGMVTAGFLPYLLRNGFMGRPGGTYGEMIPAAIVQEELLQAKSNRPSPDALKELKEQVAGLPYYPLSASAELVSRARRLKQQLYDKNARWQLKPKMASNVEIVQKDDSAYIRRLHINDTLAVVNPKRIPFLHKLDAKEDCSALYAQSSMTKDDFWKYMYMLWEKKIIVF